MPRDNCGTSRVIFDGRSAILCSSPFASIMGGALQGEAEVFDGQDRVARKPSFALLKIDEAGHHRAPHRPAGFCVAVLKKDRLARFGAAVHWATRAEAVSGAIEHVSRVL